ncbi:MAG: putative transrane protein [Polaromonas sp.]|jgi:hypothetical protein|nr:putative transrane protein [Polaromonas sp.]
MINSQQNRVDILQDRFGLKVASCLTATTSDLPYDIAERLRAAREQAVSQRRIASARTVSSVVSLGRSAALTADSDEGLSWWARIGTAIPLLVLLVGLIAIHTVQSDNRAQELAEVDAALLTDVLPPAAFADPGFVQFLKANLQARAS